MTKAEIDIEIDQGSTFFPIFTWEESDGSLVDLSSDYIGEFVIKSRRENGRLIHKCSSDGSDLFLNAQGEILPLIFAQETALFDFDWAYYDLLLQRATDNRPYIIAGGNVKLNRSVIV